MDVLVAYIQNILEMTFRRNPPKFRSGGLKFQFGVGKLHYGGLKLQSRAYKLHQESGNMIRINLSWRRKEI